MIDGRMWAGVVHVPLLNRAFSTAPLRPEQWLVCMAMASIVLWVSEARKALLRRADRAETTGRRRL